MNDDVEQYRRAFEKAPDAMVFADDEGRCIDANQSACDLFGLEKDELLGRSIEEFAPELYDFEAAWADFQTSDGEMDTFPLVRNDGTRLTVEYAATPNIVQGVHLATLRDITDHRERERKLRETQTKYRQLVEQNLVGIYIIQDRTFTYVNPRAADIFDETPEDMIGRSPFDWIAEEDHERVTENLRKREEGEVNSLKFTVTGKRSHGETFDFQVYGGRVEIDGRPAILGTLQDVTERKERERKLEQQNERLEEFADILSHDIRNPLNIAQGHLELAQAEQHSEHLERVERAHDRIETLVEDLLLLAREDTSVSEPEYIDLADLMEASWDNVDTETATLVTDTSVVVQGDGSRLQQLGENLLRNAVEHGGASVTITIGDLDDGSGFYVEDDGHGIPDDEREAVFERGYSSSEDGLGVGLSLVRQIAESHGWTVTLAQNSDDGARFEFTWDNPT